VLDRVIALPHGFMAWHDRTARDLALAHELAHHRGHDLLANFVAQPLFALHWFNPLGWYGWSAMRRDQEAACDARVVAGCARELRGTYASVIASFAAGPNVALAAPMACPVLGQKSVIHRLRSLTMNDISPRRRMAGRVLLALGVLALPATASITYAKTNAAQDVPAPPLPPAPPSVPDAPDTPVPPALPEAVREIELAPGADGEARKVVIVRREAREGDKPGEAARRIIERSTHVFPSNGKEMSEEERAKLKAELRESMKDMHVELDAAKEARRVAMVEMRRGLEGLRRVEVKCADGSPSTTLDMRDGRRVSMPCRMQIEAQAHASAQAHALTGLTEARASIAANKDMDESIRQQVLSSLDAEIARLQAEKN
jgi:bla regulator protein blaR1